MTLAHRLAFAFFFPVFPVVLWMVRAVWLAYLASLTEAQLPHPDIEHSTAVPHR